MHSETISFPWQQGGTMHTPVGEEVTGSLVKNQTQAVAFDAYNHACGEVTHTLRRGTGASGDAIPQTFTAMAVRRLTPRECERLQCFPDDYTLIPWNCGKIMAECPRGPVRKETPDGPRYKALGNSMAVPVMAWIGQRIAIVDAIPDADKSP